LHGRYFPVSSPHVPQIPGYIAPPDSFLTTRAAFGAAYPSTHEMPRPCRHRCLEKTYILQARSRTRCERRLTGRPRTPQRRATLRRPGCQRRHRADWRSWPRPRPRRASGSSRHWQCRASPAASRGFPATLESARRARSPTLVSTSSLLETESGYRDLAEAPQRLPCQTCPDSLRNNGCDQLAAADLCNVWLTLRRAPAVAAKWLGAFT
jgi:hypothetical protein